MKQIRDAPRKKGMVKRFAIQAAKKQQKESRTRSDEDEAI